MKKAQLGIFGACGIALTLALSADGADFSGWSKKAKVTFAGYSQAGSLTNFPALVIVGTNISAFSYAELASPSGGDLRFSSADGTTELNYEIDTWTNGGLSHVWVQVPVLATSSDYIWVYWGNPAQTTPPVSSTNGAAWSSYRGVWHLGETAVNGQTSAVHRDSTMNRLDGLQNQNNNAAGRLGVGQYLDGNNDWIDIANKSALSMGSAFTFSGWLRFDGTSIGWNRPISRKTSYNANSGWELQLHSGSDTRLDAGGSSGTQPYADPMVPSWTSHAWYYVTVVFNGGTATFYRDGVLRGSGALTTVVDNTNPLVFGNNSAHSEVKWNGMIDEFRIQAATPSSNWVWATYQNMASNQTFQTYGAAQSQNSTEAIISSQPAVDVLGTAASAVGYLTSTGTSSTAVSLHWGTTDGVTNVANWTTNTELGTIGIGGFTNTLSPLGYGQTYYYRHSASNAAGRVWASSTITFTTLGPSAFSAWSAVGAPISAALSATLSSTGAAPTTVSCWFGTSAGAISEVESWSATTQPQTFNRTQPGLTPGTTYYYAFKAVNTTPDSTTWTVWTPTNSLTTASDYVWDGGGSGNNWSSGGNWDYDAAPGAADTAAKLTFSTAGNSKHTANADASTWGFQKLTFENLQAPLLLTGGQLIPGSGGIENKNTTAGRAVTVSNAIQIASAQVITTPDNANSVLTLAGDLTGSGNLAVNANSSSSGTLPAVRLGGTNAAYSGTISLGAWSGGIWLLRPQSMIGGNINVSGGNANLHVSSAAGTYTFGIGTGAGCVSFRGANDGDGLYWNGGKLSWDPGNGGDCALTGDVGVNGDMANDSVGLDFGNSSSLLRVTGGNRTIRWPRGRTLGEMRFLFGLGDDGSARQLNLNNGGAYRPTRPASGNGGSSLYVENGATLTVADNTFLPAGPLRFNEAWLMLENASWSAFLASRALGTGNGQLDLTPGATYRFAARGTQLDIDSGAFLSPLGRDLYLGTENRTSGGGFYDTAGVTVSAPITLSTARTIWLARTGRGHEALTAAVHRITGNISGTGSLKVRGLNPSNLSGRVGELELAGANSWTGSPRVAPEGMGFCAGPGGLIVGTDLYDGGDAFVVFDGQASLPTGNGGATAYLATARRNYGGGDYWHGYLLKGSASGSTYELPTGLRFVLNRLANNVGLNAVLGSTEGAAALVGSTVAVNVFGTDAGQQWVNAAFLTRRNSVLTLGAPGKPVTLMPTASGNDSGTVNATTLADRANASTLVKRGEGSLILGNVLYRKLDGATDASAQCVWQFGRGGTGVNTLTTPTFDGAIRSVLNGDSSNSIAGRNVRFYGAVLELDASGIAGSTANWSEPLGTGADQVTFDGGNQDTANLGGGWAAYSTGTVGRIIVSVSGYDPALSGGTDAIKLGSQPHFFSINDNPAGPNSEPLMLGSRTANAIIDVSNNLELSHRMCQIRAIDNPNSSTDRAVVSGRLQSVTENRTGGLTLTGDGLIEFSCPTNTHRGTFNILGARVLLTGNIAKNTSTLPAVTCVSGAFGGTGVVERDVTIQTGGTMLAMPPGSTPLEIKGATLTISGQVTIDRDQTLAGGRWPVARATNGGVINYDAATVPEYEGNILGGLSMVGDTLYLGFSAPATIVIVR